MKLKGLNIKNVIYDAVHAILPRSNQRMRELYKIRTSSNPTSGNRTLFNVTICLVMLAILTSSILAAEFTQLNGSVLNIPTFASTRQAIGIFLILVFLLIDGSPETLGLGIFFGLESIARAIDYNLIVTPHPIFVQHVLFQLGDIMRLYFVAQLCRLAPKDPKPWLFIGLILSIPYGIGMERSELTQDSGFKILRELRDPIIGLIGFWMAARVAIAIKNDRLHRRILALSITALCCLDAPFRFFVYHFMEQNHNSQLLTIYLSTFSIFTYYLFPLSTLINISTIENRVKSLADAHTAESIRKAKEEEQINDAIAKTTQMLAHDIRKPFSLVRAYLDMFSTTKDSNEIQSLVDRMVPDVSKALFVADQMTKDVMDIGHAKLNIPIQISVSKIIKSSLDSVYRVVRHSQTSFKYRFNHQGYLRVDENKVVRAITNIIENAEQLISGNHDTITISTRNDASMGKPQIAIAIHNTGTFISAEDIPHIFEAFFTRGKKNGTGLGLTIVKRIVLDHGGQVSVDSEKGRGTTFTLLLPAEFSSNEDLEYLPASSAEIRSAFTGSSGKMPVDVDLTASNGGSSNSLNLQELSIVIVDDEPGYGESVVVQLNSNLTNIKNSRCFVDPYMALKFVRTADVDIVISDFDLDSSEIDGTDLLKQAKLVNPKILTVLLTNHLLGPQITANANGKIDLFLSKPLTSQGVDQIATAYAKMLPIQSKPVLNTKKNLVVVVDDDITFADAFTHYFAPENLKLFDSPEQFLTAIDGGILKDFHICAVITDYHFDNDEKSGLDVAKLTNSIAPKALLILFTNDVVAQINNSENFDICVGKDVRAAAKAAKNTIAHQKTG